MRKYLLLILLVFALLPLCAQELTVKSFAEKTNDLAASTYERKDGNGNSCALIKVQLATAGAQFSPNVVGNVEYKVNEYWVYLPTINKHLEVKHPSFLTKDVVFADYGVKLEPKTTYSLVLAMPEGGSAQQVVTSQYLLFNVKPEDAIVEVNGEVWTNTNGVSRKFVPFGEYSYTVEANNYHTYSGTVKVNDPNNKSIVDVNLKPAFGSIKIPSIGALAGAIVYVDNKKVGSVPYLGENIPSGVHHVRITKPMYKSLEQEVIVKDGEVTEFSPELFGNFATVTLSVGNDAKIFVNDELKGSGSWTGELEYGDYNVKTENTGHRPQSKVYTISVVSNHQTIALTPPTPIYGSVNIAVLPDESDVFLDGKKVGTTPLFLQQVLVGDHKLDVKKDGYQAMSDDISVRENTTCNIENKELTKGQPPRTFSVNGVSFEMVLVEAGTFTMGATSEMQNADDNEKPAHEVTLTNDYYIGKTEVTQALWKAVMSNNPSRSVGDNKPVERVSWNDCQQFLLKLNAATGKHFRLPTEAEWEFAARGGNYSHHYLYSGSNQLADVAWYDLNSNGSTHDVACKQPNELGLYDLSGNVEEICSDWYGCYSSHAQTNPTGADHGGFRVTRGGFYINEEKNCRSSSRHWCDLPYGYVFVGLRLALSKEGNEKSEENLKIQETSPHKIDMPLETISQSIYASSNISEDNKVYDVVEQMPSFVGGLAAWSRFVASNLQYPTKARANGIQGRVVTTFIVEKDGTISNAKVVRSVEPSIDQEALRIVKSMPKWTPGKQNGKPVRVKYNMPVVFRL